MKLSVQKICGLNHPNPLLDGENIADHHELDILVPLIKDFSYYLREPEDCPFGRGNWILEMNMKDGLVAMYKYPKDMTEERFLQFLQPLFISFYRE